MRVKLDILPKCVSLNQLHFDTQPRPVHDTRLHPRGQLHLWPHTVSSTCRARPVRYPTGMKNSPSTQLVVAAAIVNNLDCPTHLLCAQRSYPPELAGKWELPGGKVEPHEDPVHALGRELQEELGITVQVGPLVPAREAAISEEIKQRWHEIYAHGGTYADQVDGDVAANLPDGSADWPLVADLRMRVWVCQLAPNGGMPALTSLDGGHQELRWVPWKQVPDLDWLPADYPILEGIRDTIGT